MPHRDQEKIYLNALNLLFRENFLRLPQIVTQYHSLEEAFHDLARKQNSLIDPFKEWEKLEQHQIKFITLKDQEYPLLLKEISYPPLGLYLKGEIPKNTNLLSVVGTRKISSYGKLAIEKLLKDLISYNFVIISGLALGVDTLSHKIALDKGGKTIAVLGTGLDRIFPVDNKFLSQKIIQNGALISEYPLGTIPFKSHFPWRNRIISGLSPATLVIEAPEKSGALITANFALEQNRDVFAVPGSVFNNNSLGTNKLIKQGAKLISQTEDILEEYHIKISTTPKIAKTIHFDNQLEKEIYETLETSESLLVDKIIEKVNHKTTEVLVSLASLELKGLIKHLEGDRYSKI
ncbi:MAG: DNA-processing protein DprA [Candidatus Paceibacterota bacterium]|jgi:DNA processing protein